MIKYFNQYTIKRFCILLFIFSCLLIWSPPESSGQGVEQIPDLKFQRIHEGLVSNRVSGIFQDYMDYIWVGTHSGLHRYDGLQFQVYSSTADTTSINDNFVGYIFEDRNKQLWIGTGDGVARYNRETDDFTRFKLPNSIHIESGFGNMVTTILEDKNGKIWVSNGGAGLFSFDKKSQKFLAFKGFEEISINLMTLDSGNILWLASDVGLAKLNIETGHVQYYRHDPNDPNSISSSVVARVVVDAEGTLWAGIRGTGLNKLVVENGKEKFIHYRHEPGNPKSLFNNEIYNLYIDRKGKLWVGNENGGLHLYNKEDDSFTRYLNDPKDPTSLIHNSVWSIFQDRQERYWIGTAQTGIGLADPYGSKFTHYSNNPLNPSSLSNDVVRDILENEDGTIWIGTDGGGLNHFNRETGTFNVFKNNPNDPSSLQSDAVVSLNKDPQGRLWVGTWGGSVNIMLDEKAGRFTTFGKMINKPQYGFKNIFDVHFEEKYIWLGAAEEGLYRYSKQTNEVHLFSNKLEDSTSLTTNSVLRIFEDSKQNLWVGTFSGLNLIKAEDKDKNSGIIKRFLPSPDDEFSISGYSIRQIFEDSKHNVWIATNGGLSKYVEEKGQFINYFQSDGLPVNDVNSIIEDDKGFLWIGTNQGLSRFDPVNSTFANFDQSDGFLGNEFSMYSVNKSRKGELLFGGMSGFILFHPENLGTNPNPPKVYLTDLRLFNRLIDVKEPESPLTKHISVSDTLVLSYKQSVISLEFIALNFTQAEQNEYAYKLEGFEDDWNYVGTQRNATYTNLSPGKYVFRVKASNNDGLWNEEGTSLVLIITPPFWQTIWFYVLSVLFIGSVLMTGYWLRVRRIHEYNKELEQTVEERTVELKFTNSELKKHISEKDKLLSIIGHDLRNPFVSIIGYMEMLEDEFKSDKTSDHLVNIRYLLNVSRNTHNLLENLLQWASSKTKVFEIQPEVIDMEQVVDTAISMVSSQASFKHIQLEKCASGPFIVNADRNMILTVLRNLISNSIKFSEQNSTITIGVREENGTMITSVADNGVGMNKEILQNLFVDSTSHQTGTMGEKGTGLGLVLCQELVLKHNGKIWAESIPGKGSTFFFTLHKYEPELELK